MDKVLVSGASGFIGGSVVTELSERRGCEVVAVSRRVASRSTNSVLWTGVGLVDGGTDWRDALKDVSVVVHAAARVHIMSDRANDALASYRAVNVEGTLNLARQARDAGVRRFIYISSIKVNGEETSSGRLYRPDDACLPRDPYGISKREAEDGLKLLAENCKMDIVIIRPPLVYGPGVKANFLSMMRWLYKGTPLPLGAIPNKRSLVARDNLVDLIVTCIDHPKAANQIFLAGDGEDLSTTDLLRRMGQALGRPARLLPVPAWMLATAATMLGKRALSQRLCGSLQVDICKTRQLLGWSPPLSVDAALAKTAQYFLEHQRK